MRRAGKNLHWPQSVGIRTLYIAGMEHGRSTLRRSPCFTVDFLLVPSSNRHIFSILWVCIVTELVVSIVRRDAWSACHAYSPLYISSYNMSDNCRLLVCIETMCQLLTNTGTRERSPTLYSSQPHLHSLLHAESRAVVRELYCIVPLSRFTEHQRTIATLTLSTGRPQSYNDNDDRVLRAYRYMIDVVAWTCIY